MANEPGRFVLAGALSIMAGVCMAVQSRANGELARHTGQALEAATVSMAGGLLVLLVPLGFRRSRDGIARAAAALRRGELRWWFLTSGALGAALLIVQSWAVPTLGVALFTVAFVAGQTGNALLVDRFGLGPGGPRAVAPLRVAAAALAVAGVAVSVSGQGFAALAVLPVLAALLVGGTNMLQQAWNGRVSLSSRSVYVGTLANFGVGSLVLGLLTGIQALAGRPPASLAGAPWWAFIGGVLGIVFIAVGAWAGRHVGILVFAVTSLLGNLGGAVLLDLASPAHPGGFGLVRLGGVLVTFVAAALAAWAGRPRRRSDRG